MLAHMCMCLLGANPGEGMGMMGGGDRSGCEYKAKWYGHDHVHVNGRLSEWMLSD